MVVGSIRPVGCSWLTPGLDFLVYLSTFSCQLPQHPYPILCHIYWAKWQPWIKSTVIPLLYTNAKASNLGCKSCC